MSANDANSRPAKRIRTKDGSIDASFIAQFLSRPTPAAALAFLTSKSSCTRSQRRRLAVLAGIESSWCNCDQSVRENVSGLAGLIVREMHRPYWFYRNSLFGGGSGSEVAPENSPRSMFDRKMATPPLLYSKKFWTASNGAAKYPWLPALEDEPQRAATFDAVVHFVQASSGTGVHVGDGRILTCAHVVQALDDDDDASIVPDRIGRKKIVVFASGRAFVAECRAAEETFDGSKDVALLLLGAELRVGALHAADKRIDPPAAVVADKAAARGSKLFCIGNPSNVDLEGHGEEDLELDPPTWHASVGACQGYLDPSVHGAEVEKRDARGRLPSRAGRKAAGKMVPVDADAGVLLLHSCWTYWGHSGAPLFDLNGKVVGLHCSWDDRTGIRHGQKLQHVIELMRSLP